MIQSREFTSFFLSSFVIWELILFLKLKIHNWITAFSLDATVHLWFFDFQKLFLDRTYKIRKGFLMWSVVSMACSCEKTSFFWIFLSSIDNIFWTSKNHKWRAAFTENMPHYEKHVCAPGMSSSCSHKLVRKLKKFLNHYDLHHHDVFFLIFAFRLVFLFPGLSPTSLCISPQRRFRQITIHAKLDRNWKGNKLIRSDVKTLTVFVYLLYPSQKKKWASFRRLFTCTGQTS